MYRHLLFFFFAVDFAIMEQRNNKTKMIACKKQSFKKYINEQIVFPAPL